MKIKNIITIIILLVTLLNIVSAVSNLQVEKFVENKDLKTGESVKVFLKFKNPFQQKILIRIKDKNIIGNNGVNIECLEYLLPEKEESILAYEPIETFSQGTYELESAEITYDNPLTGKEEKIESNKLEISIKGSSNLQQQISGITTIYKCGGVSMQSTSYSSYSNSLSIQTGGGTSLSQQLEKYFNQQRKNFAKRIQNNQLNQNTAALKQQIEKQIQQKKQQEEKFKENLSKNEEFQKKHKELTSKGYEIKNSSFKNLSSENTGSFEINYQNKKGEKAMIKGEMKNGVINNLVSKTHEDEQNIIKLLEANEDFKKYNAKLKRKGFSRENIIFEHLQNNFTKITVPYKKDEKENNIFAEYVNGTIKNVQIEKEEKNSKLWVFLALILLLTIAFIIIYKTYFKKEKNNTFQPVREEKKEKPVDFLKETMKMIRTAKRLFEEKKEKDAYEKLSQAIRFYFSHKKMIKKELTSYELLKILKGEKNFSLIKNCLEECNMVEFAKHKPSKKEFNKILESINKIIHNKNNKKMHHTR